MVVDVVSTRSNLRGSAGFEQPRSTRKQKTRPWLQRNTSLLVLVHSPSSPFVLDVRDDAGEVRAREEEAQRRLKGSAAATATTATATTTKDVKDIVTLSI